MAREQTRVEELACIYSDAYKDAFGFRPRIEWQAMSEQELEKAIDELQPHIEAAIAEDREREQQAAVRLEARIAKTIADGAGDRDTAIRWIDQAEGANGDREYLSFLTGVRYGYFNQAHA